MRSSSPLWLLLRRFLHDADHFGLAAALRRIGRRPAAPLQPGTHPFDHEHHSDTSGFIPGEQIASPALAGLCNTGYYGISPSTLRQAFALLPVPVNSFTFIDLGCGKGRALLIAAQLPFRRILGVEISPELTGIAQANTAHHPRIAVQLHDAATFPFPPEPLVLFLYHPFLPPILRRVLRNLARQRLGQAHPTYLLYANPAYREVLASFPCLYPLWDSALALSPEDADADAHGITFEHYHLFQIKKPI